MLPKPSTPLRIHSLCLALFVLAVGGITGVGGADANRATDSVPDINNPDSRRTPPSTPIRALLLGTPHADVTPQILVERIAKQISVSFDIRTDWQSVLRDPNFATNYDVIVYCPCDPESRDMELVNNALQTARNGKATVLLHCALHTFRHVPAWTELLGIRTITHDGYRELTIKRAAQDHPITKDLPESWHTAGDELYAHEYVLKGVTPLLTAYSVQTKSDHVVAWAHTYGNGRVFGTSLGHDLKTVDTVPYQNLLARGLAWAANREYADIAFKTLTETK
jgi:type 1 glutamine amidotransferase